VWVLDMGVLPELGIEAWSETFFSHRRAQWIQVVDEQITTVKGGRKGSRRSADATWSRHIFVRGRFDRRRRSSEELQGIITLYLVETFQNENVVRKARTRKHSGRGRASISLAYLP
jgi:hypothetical protein